MDMRFISLGIVTILMAMSQAGGRPITDVPKHEEITRKSAENTQWDTNETDTSDAKIYCGKGEKYDTESDSCKPCDEKTYMSKHHHRMTKCCPCPVIDFEAGERFANNKTECTKESPPEILCPREDQFYEPPKPGEFTFGNCNRCTICYTNNMYEGRKCSMIHGNTVCCPLPDMEVVDTNEGPRCLNRTLSTTTEVSPGSTTPSGSTTPPGTTPSGRTTPHSSTTPGQIRCGKDEFLFNANSICKPCPPGKHQTKTNHSEIECLRKHEESMSTLSPGMIVCIVLFSIVLAIFVVIVVIVIYKKLRRVTQPELEVEIPMLPNTNRNEAQYHDTNSRGENTEGGNANNEDQNTGDDGINNEDQNTGGDGINNKDQNTGDDGINNKDQNTGDDDASSRDPNSASGGASSEDHDTDHMKTEGEGVDDNETNSGDQTATLGGLNDAVKAPLARLNDL